MEHVDANSKEYNEKMFRHFASMIQPLRVIEAKAHDCTVLENELNKPRNIKITIVAWLIAVVVAFSIATGIITPVVELILAGMVPADIMNNEETIQMYLNNNKETFLMMAAMSVIGVVVISILEIVGMFIVSKRIKDAKKTRLEEQYRIAKEDFNKEFDKYEKDLKLVPKGYLNSNALDFLVKEYRSGKADTVKEALQAYDLYCHRNRLEQQQQQILQNQAVLSDQIKRNADDIIISMFMK